MTKLTPFLVSAALLALLFLPIRDTVSGDDPDHDRTSLVTTERRQIGNNPDALIWTWGRFQGDVPLSIGVSFTDPALIDMFTALPDGNFPYSLTHLTAPELEPARVYNMDFPDKVHKEHNTGSPEKMRRNYNMRFPEKVRTTTPFDHMGWFANAQGHAPRGVFDVPHVDVHFFTITVEDREAISGQLDDPKLLAYPPAGFLPADFCLPLAVFPPQCKTLITLTATDIPGSNDSQQGLHWVDQFAPELRGEPFRQIFIFGSYDGKVDFWEPMITQQFFEDVRSFLTDLQSTGHTIALTFDIKQPEQFLQTSYYPTQYTIRYDADAGEFSVSLDNFVLRNGTQVAMQ